MRLDRLPPRTLAIIAWLAAFTAYSLAIGLPTKRANALLWIALAIVALGVERPRATLRSFATTWLPLFAALGAYDLLRGASDDPTHVANTWPHLDIDVWIGGGTIPSVHLQQWLWDPSAPAWYDYASWAVYQSHFFVPLLVAVALWSLRDAVATRYVIALALLSWMALATYWLYPAQPPWMVVRDGVATGDLDRVVQHVWREVGVERAARVFTTDKAAGSRYSNPVAALPSLHAAFPMLVAIALWGRRRWLDAILAAYVLAMAWTLVYAGEHFTFDILLGWAYAAIVGIAVIRYPMRSRSQATDALSLVQSSPTGTAGS
jgi:hypothetical protein